MASCNNIPFLPEYDPLIGCNGNPHSCQFLQTILEDAIIEENYELCARIKLEQDRRKKEGIVIYSHTITIYSNGSTKPPNHYLPPGERT